MAEKDDCAERYFQALALPGSSPSTAHAAALDRAHELRKFEIENYWKRSTYFWGFQLVAFGALALTAKNGHFYPAIVVLVAVLGALTSYAGILTARGSKFWQQNWEAHVDFLEVAVEGKLHMTALVEKNLSFSVSRVNERLLEVFFSGWLIVFIASASSIIWPSLLTLHSAHAKAIQIIGPLTALIGGLLRLTLKQKSNLRGRAYSRKTLMKLE
jgi:hypothetical protein